jgi:hypothetical protein
LEFVLDFYDAWLRSDDPGKVAAALHAKNTGTVLNWMERHEELQLAKRLADSRRGTRETFTGYIFKHLSREARTVWEEIQFWDEASSYDKIEAVLTGQTKRIRQELFIHALVSTNFDISEALRMVAMSRTTFNHWRDNDLEFRQLVEEIQWHKKNFFEHALMDLVEQRHPSAVLFVNRTINADRGYSEKLEVQHSGSIAAGEFNIEELDLDLDTRRKILEAMRRKKQAVQDVQAVVTPARLPALPAPEDD